MAPFRLKSLCSLIFKTCALFGWDARKTLFRCSSNNKAATDAAHSHTHSDLYDNKLVGTLPSELGRLTRLTGLYGVEFCCASRSPGKLSPQQCV
jgi:hypothetical protein